MAHGGLQHLAIQGLKLDCPCCIEEYIGEIMMFIEDYKDDRAMLNNILSMLQDQFNDNLNLSNSLRANVFLAFRDFTASLLETSNKNTSC